MHETKIIKIPRLAKFCEVILSFVSGREAMILILVRLKRLQNKNSKSWFFNGSKNFVFVSSYVFHSFKTTGGLEEEVDDKIIHAAFIPFGEITDIQIPIDYETSKHRGFAFVEFELAEDAAAAIDNMNESELYGRTIRVNLAKPMKNKEGGSKAIWNTDEYLQEHVSGENKENADDDQQPTSDQTTDEVIVFGLLNYWLYHLCVQ